MSPTTTTSPTPSVPTEDGLRDAFRHAELLTRVRLLESTLRSIKSDARIAYLTTTDARAVDWLERIEDNAKRALGEIA